MINIHTNAQPLNRVTALFADSSLTFLLPQNATLEHIADRVDGLGARREQRAIAVVVKIAATTRKGSGPGLTAALPNGLLAELPRLQAISRSMARDPDRADDLVQETLAKAWAHRSSFRQGTNLTAWLFTILRNTHFGEFRSRRRGVSDSEGHHAAQLVSPPPQLHYLELQDVARAFEGLTAVQREALFLVGVSGMSYDEAACVGGCAVGTIKSRVFRAREILLQKLGGGKRQTSVLALAAWPGRSAGSPAVPHS